MTTIVDASVALKWFVEEDLVEEAESLLRRPGHLLAPDLIVPELTNALWKKLIRKQITHAQAQDITAAIPRLRMQLVPSVTLHQRALNIAIELRHPVYDCLYIACAEMIGGTLITADGRLCRALEETAFAPLIQDLQGIQR